MRPPLAVLALPGLLAPAPSAQSKPTTPPLHWGPAPAVFPKGARMAVIQGDPGKPGSFTIELSMPAGYRIPPHFHPTDERVVIKKGTFLVGMGDDFDLKQTQAMAVGDTGTIPAMGHHFAAAKVATIVSVTAEGPFAMTYVHPQDEPQKPKPAGT
jgi:quercetin dioxygenase-like cupin family protein